MKKRIIVAILALVTIVIVLFGVYFAGGYQFLQKQLPAVTKNPSRFTTYVNPVFGYSLTIPAGYEVQSQTPQASTSGRPVTHDVSCIIRQSDNACILPLQVIFDETKPAISVWLKSPPEYFKSYSFVKTKISAYDAITWEINSNINYLLMDNGLVLRAYFLSKNSDVAKSILDSLKLKSTQ